jgi:hypothetical protein
VLIDRVCPSIALRSIQCVNTAASAAPLSPAAQSFRRAFQVASLLARLRIAHGGTENFLHRAEVFSSHTDNQ